jgi:hypothetical protein
MVQALAQVAVAVLLGQMALETLELVATARPATHSSSLTKSHETHRAY